MKRPSPNRVLAQGASTTANGSFAAQTPSGVERPTSAEPPAVPSSDPPPPLSELLHDPDVGVKLGASMAAIRAIVRELKRQVTLPLAVPVALAIIYDVAEIAAHLGLEDVVAGSTSARETRRRIEDLARRLGSEVDVVVRREEGKQHPPLHGRTAHTFNLRLLARLGAAWLHLHGIAPDESLGFVASRVKALIERETPKYLGASPSQRGDVLDRICDRLVPLLGRRPTRSQVEDVATGVAKRGRRGIKFWEPLAVLVSPPGALWSPEAVRRALHPR